MDDSYSEEFISSSGNFGDDHLKKRNLSGSNSSKEIRKAVEECLLSSSSALDVSRKNIKHLIEEMYRLSNIKYLHLEGNVISTIPEDLFQKLPHLVWLDLWYNKIKALPPGIGYHRQLKTLLLERNPIKEVPAELGNLTSLTALNLRHCPLEFPPKDVIQKGLKSILCFLRDSGSGKLLCKEPAIADTKECNLNTKSAMGNVSYYVEKQDHTPEKMGERLLKVKDEATRSLGEKKLEQCFKQHTQVMKAGGEQLEGPSQVEMKKVKQDIETVRIFSFSQSTVNMVLCIEEQFCLKSPD